ncbi:MAG: response regulator, partial [Nitrospirota bacterium]
MADKILIIDDDEDFANLLELLLRKKGYETSVAYCGKDAISAAVSFAPAVIVQDYMLPDISGLELTRELKKARQDAKVIIVTAKGDEETAVELMKAGATDYLKKPFETEKLLLAVENVLKLRSSEDEVKKLSSEVYQYNSEFMALNAISQALVSAIPSEEKYRSVAGVILKTMKADLAVIFTAGMGKTLKLLAAEAKDGPVETALAKETGLASYVAGTKKTSVVADFSVEKRFKVSDELKRQGVSAAIAVPMMMKDSLRGVLAVYTKGPRTFSSIDMKIMTTIACLMAAATENDYLSGLLGMFQSQWQVSFDAVPERLTIQDLDHRILMANKAAADFAGLEVKDIVGQKCSWVFHNLKEPLPACPIEEVKKTKAPVKRTVRLEGKDYVVSGYPV